MTNSTITFDVATKKVKGRIWTASLVAASWLPGGAAQVDPPKGCPEPKDLTSNPIKMKTLSGYYLGYSTDDTSTAVKWHQGTEVAGYGFDWNFHGCANTNYHVVAAGKSSKNALECGAQQCRLVDSSSIQGCDDKDWRSFQVVPVQTACALQRHGWFKDSYICVDAGKAAPTDCYDKTSDSSQMVFISGDAGHCEPVTRPVGEWIPIGFSSVPNDLSLEFGVTHSYTKSNTVTWGVSATNSLNLGFSYQGATIGDTLSGTVSRNFAKTYSSALTQSKTETRTWHFGPGQVWQFQFTFSDACGSSTAMGNDIALTNSRAEPPCCLPGFSKNASEPHGECVAASDGKVHDVCKKIEANDVVV